jgi:hypothetical protein
MRYLLPRIPGIKPAQERPTRWKSLSWMLVVALSLLLAACTRARPVDIPTASGSPAAAEANPAGTSPSLTPVDPFEAALAYAQCIRENGYPEWPDPNADGQFMMRRDQGMSMNDPRRMAAMEACQDQRPPGNYGAGPGGMVQGFAGEEALLDFALCMRDNGVPGFPDPGASGGRMVIGPESGINPFDPTFQEAMTICMAAMTGATE